MTKTRYFIDPKTKVKYAVRPSALSPLTPDSPVYYVDAVSGYAKQNPLVVSNELLELWGWVEIKLVA